MASLFFHYLEANWLVLVSFLLVKFLRVKGVYRSLLLSVRAMVVLVLAIPLFLTFFPQRSFISPSAQIWHATSMRKANEDKLPAPVITVGKIQKEVGFSLDSFSPLSRTIFAVLLLTLLYRLGRGAWELQRVLKRSYLVRQIGKVQVRIVDGMTVPFSFWTPWRALVVLPNPILERPSDKLIAIRHELQHHRQRDTHWSYFLECFRCLFFFNPFSHLLLKEVTEIQEFACDEALVERKNVSPHAYGGCLLWVAQTARSTHPVLVGTTCMAVSSSGSFLKRRIHHMLNIQKQRYLNRLVSAGVGIAGVVLLATTAWASQGMIQDRRVSYEEAVLLVKNVKRTPGFPVTVNKDVVKELNRFVGTPDGREFIKNALMRMEGHRVMVEQKLDEYFLPRELMALPIIESGYQNLPQAETHMKAAGVWQFIPETARNYGLRVDSKVDERLHIEKETDAGCRYLGALNYRFRDWELAITGYNAGEYRVQRGINATKSRNAWTIIENGFGGDNGYLARFMAALLIMNNPSLVD